MYSNMRSITCVLYITKYLGINKFGQNLGEVGQKTFYLIFVYENQKFYKRKQTLELF